MSKTFPSLLKRSRFVTYDPTISRVYTSPLQSIVSAGDWGFKFPLNRPKKAQFLEMRSIDSGPGIRSDWRGTEKEARFLMMWGDGRTPWNARKRRAAGRGSNARNALLAEEAESSAPEVLPNVDAMSPQEFERYLNSLRARRAEFRESLGPIEVETLPEASARGVVREQTTSGFQADLVKQEIDAPGSTRVMAKPHHLRGLAYSSAPAAGAQLDPQRVHTGRVLDQAPRGATSYRGIEGVNAEWVVGLGGVTATGSSGTRRVSDRPTLSKFDYTRERKFASLARFAVKEAVLDKPPQVIGVNDPNYSPDYWLKHASAARRPQPFHTLRFDIKVNQTEPVRPGDKDWVARDSQAPAAISMLGGPKAGRTPSDRHQAARRINSKVQAESIDSLLARIVGNDKK